MKDLFGNKNFQQLTYVNIYGDEIFSKKCPEYGDSWFYIGLLVEDLTTPLLEDIINERFCGNFDETSQYYDKNNKITHWSEIRGADTKNICKRWFEYILNPNKSSKTFYSYILGINNSKLKKEEFDTEDEFNSKYNRFFRTAITYALKTFFYGKEIIVENIFHEEGTQKNNKYFPWHCIYKLKQQDLVTFHCNDIIFLPKDHKEQKEANLIQLCDCVLGVSTSIIHGIDKSNNSKYREELADLYLPLFRRVVNESGNINSRYQHHNRIIIRFFPKDKTIFGDERRLINQFYYQRNLYYIEQKTGQMLFGF